ncbi:ribosome biogenesis GTPase Der [Leadbettera azotonutricia]|uniref:GTPase Der n=1 Tax=Leadbettera azotonutricia (strain ATCC BAA-888 / DSM 13862 / ZAS-9) TaxID=545695 RepID=F5YCQ3_LEAAZ|nr:ribosome biogenesis GTPase Der [Leadbettera azotonutricia]AEF82349.1 ribosome-associated GTPase EngA [Leadbettera azotonutricia ZAS-9]
MKLPTVVLAGRPNVGKSTLFNRLLHKRRAITDPTPGVTRDPVAMDTFILGKKLKLIDTGGFKLDRETDSPEGDLDTLVVEKTLGTLKTADIIILILEAGDLTPEDEEFIELMRPYQKRLLVAVNKTEGGRREADAWNLLSYGFEKVFMISAEHGDNVGDLEEAIVSRINTNTASDDSNTTDTPIRIALLGKPNTGKSTLSNRLTASSASIVSDIPGTTRDVVEGSFTWKNRSFQVLDTAGIRRRSKVSENVEYYSVNRAIKTIDDADIVFLLIDAQEGLTEQDKKIAGLAHDKGRGIILVLNKWDTMPKIKNTFQAAQDRIHFLFGQMEYAPIIGVSGLDGEGVDTLLNTAIRMYGQLNKHIETAALNEKLARWLEENPPPIGPQTRFKVKYAVQVSDNPVKFVFFVSRKQAVSEPYVAFLRNKIRKDLGFSLIPVVIELRSSAGPSERPKKNRR